MNPALQQALAQSLAGHPASQERLLNSPYPAITLPVTRPVVPYANALPEGLVQQGNMDAGAFNPEDTRSFEFADKGYHLETLLPAIEKAKRLTDAQAVERFRKTGQHLGRFETPDAATAYAKSLKRRAGQ